METTHESYDTSRTADARVESSCGMNFGRVQELIAGKLRGAADKLPGQPEANRTLSGLAEFGSQTRTWLYQAADQIERIDPTQMKQDFSTGMQRSPGKSLLIAVGAGFLLGMIFRRR